MAHKESSDKTGYVVDVKILDVEKRNKIGPKHYVYVMQITWANPANLFIIYRRYAEFFELQCKLLDLFAHTSLESNDSAQSREIPFLPGKIILGRSQVRQIALERKQALNEYCQTLISLSERISRSRPILEFFHPLPTDVQKPIEPIPQETKSVDKSSLVISGPTKLATYRCLADFTASEKIELSLKRNSIVQVLQKHPNGWWFIQFNDQTGFVPGAYLEPSELKRGAREGKTIEKSLNETYVVNTTYEGKGKDELSLEQGSFVTVIEKSLTGWWKIKFNNTIGQYPALYLSSCDGRYTPENVIDDAPSVTYKKKELNNSHESDGDDEDDYHLDPSKVTEPELYYACKDCSDNVGDCLSFKRGDIIEIHDKHSSGWWFGRRMKGDPILSWVQANYLQKEPVTDTTVKNNNTQSSNSKFQSKIPDKVPNPSVNKQQNEKIPTTIRKNFESQSSTNDVDHSKLIKKPQPIETATAPKNSPITTSNLFRPMNDKQDTTATHKSSPSTTSSAFRPVNNKQETATANKKPPITTQPPFRPVNDKKETTATANKKPPVAAPPPFRPMNDKQETTATANRKPPLAAPPPFRPVNDKQETTATANKKPPVTAPPPFRPMNDKQETTATANRNPSLAAPPPFRPVNDKQETTATANKKPPVTAPPPFRPMNDKQETTATANRNPSLAAPPPFRPVNDKQETTATANKKPPITASSVFRPVNNKQETTTAHKNPPVTAPIPFRPVNDKQETTATANKKPSSATATSFRPVNDKQESATAHKNSPAAASSAFRPVNNKQEPTAKLVKDLVGRFNDK